MRNRFVYAVIGLLCLSSPPFMTAQPPMAPHAAPQSTDTVPVLFSISGGISRGAYMAGVNWAIIEVLRHSGDPAFRARYNLGPAPFKLALATGASAGNVNATLGAIEYCDRSQDRAPEESLFWSLWVDLGWDQLFPVRPGASAQNEALFHRTYVDSVVFPRVINRMRDARPQPDCDVPVGITLTRVEPADLQVGPATTGVTAKTQRFTTVFDVRAVDGHLRFTYPDPAIWRDAGLGKVALGRSVAGSDQIDSTWILSAMKASGAFPVAFAPVGISYQDAALLDSRRRCSDPIDDCTGRGMFLDGGVFDNNPLQLALDMYAKTPQGMRRDPNTRVIFIESDRLRARAERLAPPDRVSEQNPERGLGALLKFASGFVPSARQYELQSLARSMAKDTLRLGWLRPTSRSQPIIGAHLGSFAAFLGRPFREYDFYAGIYDGLHFAAEQLSGCETEQGCAELLGRLIVEGEIPFGPVAPIALAEFYSSEFARPLAFDSSFVGSAPEQQSIKDRRALLGAALHATRSLESYAGSGWNDLDCDRLPWEKALLCKGGFGYWLRTFYQHARSVVDRHARREECSHEKWKASPQQCPSEATLAALLREPEPTVQRTVGLILQQLWSVENAVGNRPSTRDFSRESMVEIAMYLYHGYALRTPPTRGLNADPSSIQDVVNYPWMWIARALPWSLSLHTNSGVEAGYRPTYNFGARWAVVLPASVGYRWRPGNFEAAIGPGILWRPKRGPFAVQASLQGAGGMHELQFGDAVVSPAADVTLYVFEERLRAGGRWVADPDPVLHRDRPWSWTIGITDVNGLLYWLNRRSK
jgi:predicted acylesterase/phospholipase RssA